MQKNSLNYKEGDVIVLELPFTDLIGKKLRPALILSSEKLNRIYADLIVAKIGSSRHLPDFEVEITSNDLEYGKTQENKLCSLPLDIYSGEKFSA